jgi:hypothetical protein
MTTDPRSWADIAAENARLRELIKVAETTINALKVSAGDADREKFGVALDHLTRWAAERMDMVMWRVK